MKYTSKISKGNSQRESVRITVPQGLRKLLELEPGDSIDWIITIEDGIHVEVKKSS